MVTEVLSRSDPKDRRDCIQTMLSIAQKAKSLGSFNTVLEIVAGLNNGAVQRLKKTWGDLAKKDLQCFEEMETFVSPNKSYGRMREAVRKQLESGNQCVPYLGMYLGDLVMTDEGSKTELGPGTINFSKSSAVAKIITEVVQWTKGPSNSINTNTTTTTTTTTILSSKISKYLIDCMIITDEDEAWSISQRLE